MFRTYFRKFSFCEFYSICVSSNSSIPATHDGRVTRNKAKHPLSMHRPFSSPQVLFIWLSMYVSTWLGLRPRYIIRYSGCFCEGMFRMRLTFKLLDSLSKNDYPLWYGWASSKQLKAVIEQRMIFPEQQGILPEDFLWTHQNSFLSLQACWTPCQILGELCLQNLMS